MKEVRYAKRRVENSFDCESSNKKVRFDNNVKKVAEIVMVLATMGVRIGGRKPNAVDVDMMVEAGAKMVDVCKGFAKNDVFCKDEFRVVIEELWNSKVSSSNKLQVTKRKMEKSEVFPLQSNLSEATESREPTNAARIFSSDKASHTPVSLDIFQSASFGKISSVKTEGSDSSTSRQPTANPINVNQHRPNIIQTPSTVDTDNEVSKIVQKLLHPNVLDPTPSRDFMNKTLSCQTCKVTINEMDNTLVCDACEKGYHLRCLQYNPESIPKRASQEWHCAKCLATSNGKLLQLRYGRVIRNISTAKLSSN